MTTHAWGIWLLGWEMMSYIKVNLSVPLTAGHPVAAGDLAITTAHTGRD